MKIPALMVLLATLSSGVLADTSTDQQRIEQMMRHTWERPDAPLHVGPVTVEGEHAVAGWTQGERGGRALLKRNSMGWRVVLCAGDALLDPATLHSAGLTPEAAASLSKTVAQAESTQAPERVKQFALFKGVMQVDKDAAHQGH
ncbi:copper uptake system-associated protein [Pseudomonas protegens]|uniref:Copper uptake system-associated protein n=1 Tax=Pseudomonas idahonensis TaxID=2942628 RepID=A0ABT5Q1E5_9PSED|nr:MULTISPECIES: copper uptake system-associated protein [Pseudomonas]MCO7613931.1 copper uptake system-associated protein [Pseudomonas chlororaphis]MDD1147849.1 copper uptake system-associated protein [Pseudomonas idahonensis]MDP9505146.1 copper uptake system-associated protein [Pseudomonas protegens]MDP9509941.1 copper uptake system-associated protein [Pseudomonas protegens]MDP9514170.1 copper uptake system-associated protein [Pseudomonas protegens]